MQRLKLNARIITIIGVFSCAIGMALMADWQSISHDPCTDFSLYYHPEIADSLSNGSLEICCSWQTEVVYPIADQQVPRVAFA